VVAVIAGSASLALVAFVQKRGQEVGSALIADRQAPVGQQPGRRALAAG
jgi:hypothetical protein